VLGRLVSRWPPEWPLLALCVAVPLAVVPTITSLFGVSKLAALQLGLALALIVWACRVEIDVAPLGSAATQVLLVYLGLNGLAVLGSIAPLVALVGDYNHNRGFFTLLLYAASFGLAAVQVRSEQVLARLTATISGAAAVMAVVVFAQQAGHDPFGLAQFQEDGRPTYGTIGHPNGVAEFMVMVLPLVAWLAWRGRGLQRDLPIWGSGLVLVALALTQARTAWATAALLTFCFGAFILAARLGRGRWAWPLLLLPPLAALGLVALQVAQPGLGDRVEDLADRVASARSGEPIQTRQFLWGSGLAMVGGRPLLGWGPGTMALAYPPYRSVELDTIEDLVGRNDDAHNVLIDIGVDSGVPGLAAFVALLAVVAALLLRVATATTAPPLSTSLRGAALALLASWIAYPTVYSSGKPNIACSWLFFVLGGAAVGLFWATPRRPYRFGCRGRLALLGLAVFLIGSGGGGLAADASFDRGLGAQDDEPTQLSLLRAAAALQPLQPFYSQQFGLLQVVFGRKWQDEALVRQGYDEIARAATLSGYRDPYVLMDLARARWALEAMRGVATELPLELAEQAIARDPSSPIVYADAADLAARMKRLERAQALWTEAAARAQTSDAFERVAVVALQLGDAAAARAAFRQGAARAWRPVQRAELLRVWGDAARADGSTDDAITAYSELVKATPADLDARLYLADALEAAGRDDDAVRQAQAAIEIAPDNQHAADLLERLAAQ
jgi:O-antigen ligase/tetratricopeptide (TPR) repeat protein